MRRLPWFLRGWKLLGLTLSVYSALSIAALAQAPGQKPPVSTTTGTGPYVLAYLLIILCIALGLLVVCRSSGRRDRARPEQYAEGKAIGVKVETAQKK